MNRKACTLGPLAAIVEDYTIARALSVALNCKYNYFPMMEAPWVNQGDEERDLADCVRRVNCLALIQNEQLVVQMKESNKAIAYMGHQFSESYKAGVISLRGIDDAVKLLSKVTKVSSPAEPRRKKKQEPLLKNGARVAVIEETETVSQVIAENFAVATGRTILLIPPPSKAAIELCEELLVAWDAAADPITRENARDGVFSILSASVEHLLRGTKLSHIVFFTNGLPYGILPFDCPTAHMWMHRDLGIQLLRGFCSSHTPESACSAVFFDSGLVGETEVNGLTEMLQGKLHCLSVDPNFVNRYRLEILVEHWPYDLFFISTHGGCHNGIRAKKIGRIQEVAVTVVVDLFHTFSMASEDDVSIQTLAAPVSVNDIPWPEVVEKHDSLREAAWNIIKDGEIPVEDQRPIQGQRFTNALECRDGIWLPTPDQLAGGRRLPLIFNNSCASWNHVWTRFVIAGVTGYVGTTLSILSAQGKYCAEAFLEAALDGSPFPKALFAAQRELIRTLGYSPYIYAGNYDAKLKSSERALLGLKERLTKSVQACREKKFASKSEDSRKRWDEVINTMRELWLNQSRREPPTVQETIAGSY